MFGELRSILARPHLDRDMWHAWLADPSWQLDALPHEHLFSIRQMQAAHGFDLFSVPDEVILALITDAPLPPLYVRQPERLMLCAHLELRPDVLHDLDHMWYASRTLHAALARLPLADLRAMSCHARVCRVFRPGEEAALLCAPMMRHLTRLELWGDTPIDPSLVSPGIAIFARSPWLEALTQPGALPRLQALTLRQSGLDDLQALTRSAHWSRLRHLDLSYNALDTETLHTSFKTPSPQLRALVMYGYGQEVPSLFWQRVIERHELLAHVHATSLDPHATAPHRRNTAELGIWVTLPEGRGVQRHTREGDVLVCGRSPRHENSGEFLRLAHPSVARLHAYMIHYRGTHYIIDLDSTNGVHIHRTRCKPGAPVRLTMHENIHVAQCKLRLEPA